MLLLSLRIVRRGGLGAGLAVLLAAGQACGQAWPHPKAESNQWPGLPAWLFPEAVAEPLGELPIVCSLPPLDIRFRGGNIRDFVPYVQKRIVWPLKNGQLVEAEGRLTIRFLVGLDGRVRKAWIVKSLHPLLDKAALAAISGVSCFTYKMNGKPEEAYMQMPITFRLE